MGDASSEQPGRSPRGSSGLRGERPTRSPGEGWNQGLQSPHLWPFTLSSASPALLTPIKGPTLHHKVQRSTEGLYLLGQPVPAETEPSLSSRGLEAKPLPFRNLPRVLVSRMGKMPLSAQVAESRGDRVWPLRLLWTRGSRAGKGSPQRAPPWAQHRPPCPLYRQRLRAQFSLG